MQVHSFALKTVSQLPDDLTQCVIKGISEAHMAHHASLEESERPDALGAIDNLVRHNEIPRLDLLLQTANSRKGNDRPHANGAKRSDVGTGRYLMRGEFVVQTMAREESDSDGLARRGRWVVQDGNGRRGCAPWGLDIQVCDMGEAREGLQACASNDGNVDWIYQRICMSDLLALRETTTFKYPSTSLLRLPFYGILCARDEIV